MKSTNWKLVLTSAVVGGVLIWLFLVMFLIAGGAR